MIDLIALYTFVVAMTADGPVLAQSHDHGAHPPSHQTDAPASKQQNAPPDGHAPDNHPTEPAKEEPIEAEADHSGHSAMDMTGALGFYAMSREASGTSWQPDSTSHMMGHTKHGDWTLMGHIMLNVVYDWQDGPRGDEKAFVNGMVMGAARRDFETGDVLNLRAMISPDPFMGKSGYPLLLAAGETANGLTPLVDRQHPHDFFMELSASYSHSIADADSLFVYVGYPGEPAFGPPAFMHRASIMDSPEAPITHHWFDSTHITFGVVTAGWIHESWKLEASLFTGREPDEDRFDFDDAKFDSPSVRLSWNPDANWSLQVSWADLNSPEGLEPEIDQTRWSASAIYNVPLRDEGFWATSVIFGARDSSESESQFAAALESTYAPDRDWRFFARGELIETNELGDEHHGPIETVGKISLGAIRDFHIDDNLKLGVGALYSMNFVPNSLEPSYDGDPDGAMVFVRLVAGT